MAFTIQAHSLSLLVLACTVLVLAVTSSVVPEPAEVEESSPEGGESPHVVHRKHLEKVLELQRKHRDDLNRRLEDKNHKIGGLSYGGYSHFREGESDNEYSKGSKDTEGSGKKVHFTHGGYYRIHGSYSDHDDDDNDDYNKIRGSDRTGENMPSNEQNMPSNNDTVHDTPWMDKDEDKINVNLTQTKSQINATDEQNQDITKEKDIINNDNVKSNTSGTLLDKLTQDFNAQDLTTTLQPENVTVTVTETDVTPEPETQQNETRRPGILEQDDDRALINFPFELTTPADTESVTGNVTENQTAENEGEAGTGQDSNSGGRNPALPYLTTAVPEDHQRADFNNTYFNSSSGLVKLTRNGLVGVEDLERFNNRDLNFTDIETTLSTDALNDLHLGVETTTDSSELDEVQESAIEGTTSFEVFGVADEDGFGFGTTTESNFVVDNTFDETTSAPFFEDGNDFSTTQAFEADIDKNGNGLEDFERLSPNDFRKLLKFLQRLQFKHYGKTEADEEDF